MEKGPWLCYNGHACTLWEMEALGNPAMTVQTSRPPEETTVVVAMSGGVDSSVAAALLVEQGYNCIGIMMRLWAEVAPGQGSTNRCCTLESVEDARRVADRLGIPFYYINAEKPFKRHVVDEAFIQGYASGRTPNPCLACNRHIRFGYLLGYARALGADYLATGHYARLRRQPDGSVHLLRAVDLAKDQSYVLSVLGQEELRQVLFPLGEYTKEQVRAMAAARGLPTASKHDSMDLCFVADDYRRFLRSWAPATMQPGEIVDRQGRVLGHHGGLAGYTIGQRKGLGISGTARPLYVLALDPEHNRVVVGTQEELGRDRFAVEQVRWTLDRPVASGTRAQVQIRYRGRSVGCTLEPEGADRVQVRLDEPLRDVTPGQGAVFYDGELCLGGGLIAREG